LEIGDLKRLPADRFGDKAADDDRWRLQTGWYGFSWFSLSGRRAPNYLYVGGGSGLEAALALLRSPGATVFIVEPDRATRRRLAVSLGDDLRVHILKSLEELPEGLESLDFVRIRRDALADKTLDVLSAIQSRKPKAVDHLCGSYRSDRTDPLALYRRSEEIARRFVWRDETNSRMTAGSGGGPDYEVSVIVPAYRVPAELEQCLSSLVGQTLAKLEVIVVDDGSPDETGQIADSWAERYPGRVRVIHKQNGGCASARMAGLEAARGAYVGFVDGDDWVDSRMFEELYAAAATTGADIAQCGYVLAYADGSRELNDQHPRNPDPVMSIGVSYDPVSMTVERPTIWRRIYKRGFLQAKDIQIPIHIKRFDDLPFQFEALSQANCIATTGGCYYYYRQGRPGQDIEARDEKLFVHMPIFEWMRSRVLSWGDARLERHMFRVELNTHEWALKRIDKALQQRYQDEMSLSLLQNRVHLRRRDMLAIAWKQNPDQFRLALAAIAKYGRGKRPSTPAG
jgi:glycosyltransferase involved in cell wall biosynthesis